MNQRGHPTCSTQWLFGGRHLSSFRLQLSTFSFQLSLNLERKMDLVILAAETTDYTDFTERIGSIMKETTFT